MTPRTRIGLACVAAITLHLSGCRKSIECERSIGVPFDSRIADGVPRILEWRRLAVGRMMTALKSATIKTCSVEQWSRAAIGCFGEARNEAEVAKCGANLTTAQKTSLERAISAEWSAHLPIEGPSDPSGLLSMIDLLDRAQIELEESTRAIIDAKLRSSPGTSTAEESVKRARQRWFRSQRGDREMTRAMEAASAVSLRHWSEVIIPALTLTRAMNAGSAAAELSAEESRNP